MYVPRFNRIEDEQDIRALVSASGSAQFVTVGDDGFPTATLLPIMWEGATVIAHMARANPHWRQLGPGAPALLICAGPEAYISPSWYAAKVEHGRVVPTWNYVDVHLAGRVRVHENPDWLLAAVSRLTDVHERGRADPWAVSDAPAQYIEGQLGGIVGLEIAIERVDAKAKLSQNRSVADRRGVVDGLRGQRQRGAGYIADAMEADL